MAKRLTEKQRRYADLYMQMKGNGTEAAMQAYDTQSRAVAGQISYENLRKHEVLEYMGRCAAIAAENVFTLANTAKNEVVKLNANKDILDRAGVRSVEEKRAVVLHAHIGSKKVSAIAQKVSAELAASKLLEPENSEDISH